MDCHCHNYVTISAKPNYTCIQPELLPQLIATLNNYAYSLPLPAIISMSIGLLDDALDGCDDLARLCKHAVFYEITIECMK